MTSTTSTADPAADRALQARHRATWALGDYPAVAIDVIPELGPELVATAGVRAGDRVLDVAAGAGNAAVPAALTGARVTPAPRRSACAVPVTVSPASVP